MKPIKFVLLGLGVLCAIAVFLPFVSLGGEFSISLWKLKAVKAAPTYIALLGSLTVAGLAGLAVSRGALGRGLAIGAAVAALIVAVITFLQFDAEAPFAKFSGIGAKILLFGGLIGFVTGLVGTIKPERANA